MSDLDLLREQFADAREFATSPLYSALAPTVAEHEPLLRLAAQSRHGQYPTFLFLAAVHYLLLGGADHELAEFYPSIAGDRARPPEEAGPALVSFCGIHEDALAALLRTRLVQTNAVRRSLALRLGFAALARVVDRPVHLVEVGASAGVHLRFDRYGYRLGGRQFGDHASEVQIEAERIGDVALPDLDAIPPVATATGVDLNPLDATSADDRRWLQALVWPDNRVEADLLQQALAVVAADPPPILAGDAVAVCPALAAELPPGEPRVVFLVATRMHVPADERDAFDDAVAALGRAAPLYRLTMEREPDPDPRPQPARRGAAVYLEDPAGTETLVAVVGGRVDWVEPVRL